MKQLLTRGVQREKAKTQRKLQEFQEYQSSRPSALQLEQLVAKEVTALYGGRDATRGLRMLEVQLDAAFDRVSDQLQAPLWPVVALN
jgi:hypothetical protein